MSSTDSDEVFEDINQKRYRSEAFSDSSTESPTNKIKKMETITLETLKAVLDEKLTPIHQKLDIVDALVKQNEELKSKIEKQDRKINDLECEIDKLQLILRKNNLIFRNVKVLERENAETKVTNIIKGVLKIQGDLNIVRAIPVARKSKNPGILVEFGTSHLVPQILKNSSLLQGTEISITRDLPRNHFIKENKLLAIRKEILKVNKKEKIKVRNGTMIFGDNKMTWCRNNGLICQDGANAVEKIKVIFKIDVSPLVAKLRQEEEN